MALKQEYYTSVGTDQAQILSEINALKTEISSKMIDSYSTYDNFTTLTLLLTSHFINSIMEITFAKVRRKIVEIFKFEYILNFILFILVIYQYFRWNYDFCKRTYSDSSNTKMYRLYDSFNEGILNSCTMPAIVICLLWIKATLVLSLSKIFGPMIEMISTMIKELAIFAFLFTLIFCIFLFTGKILFFQLDDFNTFSSCSQYLFNASLGTFSFDTFNADMIVSKYVGYIFIVLFVVLMNITLLNFLIAILSGIYDILKLKSIALYYHQIIRVRQIHDHDKYYSSLVATAPPFNLLIAPFAPFIILLKSEKLNNILMYICYAPVCFIGTTVFILLSILYIPFAYFILIIHQSKLIISKGIKNLKSFVREFCVLMFTIFCGIQYILILQLVDTINFVICLFAKDLQRKTHISKYEENGFLEIHPELFELLMDKINESKTERIELKELVIYFRDQMRISDQISNLIFSVRIGKKIENISFYEENKYESLIVNTESIKYELKEKLELKTYKDSKMFKRFIKDKTPKYILDQYNSLKRFLNCNSINIQQSWDIQYKDLSLDNEMHIIDHHDKMQNITKNKNKNKNSKIPQEFQNLSDGVRINKINQKNQSNRKVKAHPSQYTLHHHKYSSLQTLRIERNYLSLQEFWKS